MPEGKEEISKKRKLNIPVKISSSVIANCAEISNPDTSDPKRHVTVETSKYNLYN